LLLVFASTVIFDFRPGWTHDNDFLSHDYDWGVEQCGLMLAFLIGVEECGLMLAFLIGVEKCGLMLAFLIGVEDWALRGIGEGGAMSKLLASALEVAALVTPASGCRTVWTVRGNVTWTAVAYLKFAVLQDNSSF
jgi:hypothetical protein